MTKLKQMRVTQEELKTWTEAMKRVSNGDIDYLKEHDKELGEIQDRYVRVGDVQAVASNTIAGLTEAINDRDVEIATIERLLSTKLGITKEDIKAVHKVMKQEQEEVLAKAKKQAKSAVKQSLKA